jgi:hypothetical protein
MNDNYYQPREDRAWDHFVDWCDEEGLDPLEEDFEAWVEDMREAAEEAAAEARAEARWDY